MADTQDTSEAFAIPDLWGDSPLSSFNIQGFVPNNPHASPFSTYIIMSFEYVSNCTGFNSNLDPETDLLDLRHIISTLSSLDVSSDDLLQTLKGLDNDGAGIAFQHGPLEDVESLEASSISSSTEGFGLLDDALEGLWSAKEILKPNAPRFEIGNWGQSQSRSTRRELVRFTGQASPRRFDGTLDSRIPESHDTSKYNPAAITFPDTLISSLVQLTCGVESDFFYYDEQQKRFTPVTESIRKSGYNLDRTQSFVMALVTYGSQIRQTKAFIDSIQNSNKLATSKVALASGISIIVSTLGAELGLPLASIHTVPQIYALLQPSAALLDWLYHVIIKAEGLSANDELLSMIFDSIRQLDCSVNWLRPILDQLLVHVSRPWLDSLEDSLGLRLKHALDSASAGSNGYQSTERNSNVAPEPEASVMNSLVLGMPSFVNNDFAEMVSDTVQSLNLLQIHEPDHPLALPQSSSELPMLQWQFSWQDIEKIQVKAQKYEADVQKALNEYSTFKPLDGLKISFAERSSVSVNEVAEVEPFSTDILYQVDAPLPTPLETLACPLSASVTQVLEDTDISSHSCDAPPTTLLPSLCFEPLISAQSRLLSHATLRLLFHTHSLRTHLRILHAYGLFANGSFLIRLSDALFKPSQQSTWSPSSSELRIALMAALSESYHGSAGVHELKRDHGERDELPGGLSFAIRNDLSDAEMNKDELEAFDFLKIHYRPPKPLNVIITEAVLEKYEKVSRLLLRGARLASVAKGMMRHERGKKWEMRKKGMMVERFKTEANWFVRTVFGYFADCEEELWMAFEARLDEIEESIAYYEVGRGVESVRRVRDFHEEVLDQILAACYLEKGQGEVMRLLEEILGLILDLARVVSDGDDAVLASSLEGVVGVKDLYRTFREKVRALITICRGPQDRENVAETDDPFDEGRIEKEQGNSTGRLALRLEMNDWYMR
ncbi:MAG: hypothetical protein Q9219_003409 [cf. Caloplaca sp. 3 TL-2023]